MPRDRAVRGIADGIEALGFGFDQFGDIGQELAGDGIKRIGGINQRLKRGRNRHGIFPRDQRQCVMRVFWQKLGRNTVKSPITGRKAQTL